ncbi:MAG: DUF5658 family protein [Actinomycetota bacterium]|nr:DUF5658 family protein [Actinomycetota bacterium]
MSGGTRVATAAAGGGNGDGGARGEDDRMDRVRAVTLAAIALLAALNVADVVTTRVLVAHRGVEANPLASVLLTNQTLLWVKLAIVGLLGLRALRGRPRVGIMGAACFAAGIYATAVLSNLLVLHLATSG